MPRRFAASLLWPACVLAGSAPIDEGARAVADAEATFADARDAFGVLGAIDSGLFPGYRGRDRAAWQGEFDRAHRRLVDELAALPEAGLSPGDARVVARMREGLAAFEAPSAPGPGAARCRDAGRGDSLAALAQALVACFTEIGNRLEFEGGTIDPPHSQLHVIADPGRRESALPRVRAVVASGQ